MFLPRPLNFLVLAKTKTRHLLAPLDAVTRIVQLIECALDKQSPWKQNALREPTLHCYRQTTQQPPMTTDAIGLFLRVYQTLTNRHATLSTKDLREFLEYAIGPPAATSMLPCIEVGEAGVRFSWFKQSETDGWMGSGPLWIATRQILNGSDVQPRSFTPLTTTTTTTFQEDAALLDSLESTHPAEALIIRSALASYDPDTKYWNPHSLPVFKKVLNRYVTFMSKQPLLNSPLHDDDDAVSYWNPCGQ